MQKWKLCMLMGFVDVHVIIVTVNLNVMCVSLVNCHHFSDSNQQRLIEAMEPPPQSSCGGKQQTRLDRRLAQSF